MKYILIMYIAVGLGLGRIKIEKKEACPARVAEAGQENIETSVVLTPSMESIKVCQRLTDPAPTGQSKKVKRVKGTCGMRHRNTF